MPGGRLCVLALDLSPRIGFAAGAGARATYGAKELPWSGRNSGPAFAVFEEWLGGKIDVFRPDLIAFEKALPHAPKDAALGEFLMGLTSIARLCAGRKGIRCEAYHPATIKLFWTGFGLAKKPAMIAQARAYGYQISDDNIADGIAIWHLAKSKHGDPVGAGPLFASKPRRRARAAA